MSGPQDFEPDGTGPGATVLWALFLTVVWVGGTGALAAMVGFDARGLAILLLAVLVTVPIGLIWTVAIALGLARRARADRRRVVQALQAAQMPQTPARDPEDLKLLVRRQTEIAAGLKRTESALSILTSSRATELALQETAGEGGLQGALALDVPPDESELELADIVRALNFPVTADDEEGFAALRRALRHRATAQLVQAAQDVLTLFSQDGLYMDDLSPDLARPEVWRRFARGDRGLSIGALGGIRDRGALSTTAARMKQDEIFRDAAHHFLRVFDRSFSGFEARADDAEITAFAGTRTARAFMLLGRVAGTFD